MKVKRSPARDENVVKIINRFEDAIGRKIIAQSTEIGNKYHKTL